ncbi:MAG: hypothetical protein J6T80_02685 [Paludibacteraceae bacterium]|nr:hypothetical protein [Paludibacteraceae bacterium]
MKTTRYITLSLLMAFALTATARDFVTGETIYLYADQAAPHSDGFDWTKDGAKLFLYLFDGSGEKWLTLSAISSGSKIYKATFDANGTYNKIIVVRKDPATPAASWDGTIWNQTCDLVIPEYKNCNYINKFWPNNNCDNPYAEWKTYTPATSTIPAVSSIKSSGVTEEVVHVCPNAAGDPFSLKVKLNSGKTAYVYDDVTGHGWFYSANGTSWTSADSYAGAIRDEESEQDLVRNNLPASLPSAFYYYLYSNIPSGRRLIKIIPDADCTLDCSITSFETAISAVNADDNTYTLDGMVAFAEPNGNLVIECDGKSTTITSPKSPQSFSLAKVPAATVSGTTTTATAHFTGNASCTKTITINVPNATEGVEEVNVDSLTGKMIVLVPQDADPSNDYVWIINGVEHKKSEGQSQNCTIPAINIDSTATCVYKEYYPASGTMADMMSNGGYEDESFNYGTYGSPSTISDYYFWRYLPATASAQQNFYTNATLNPNNLADNGFAVVRNANNFWPTYAKVTPREGDNFALFDAATGATGGNKRAWYATTAKNPDLKLKKGTTYVLSFWAANINNYGEMENAARFKFRIQYNGKTWESSVLDLGTAEFRNNIWHQHSETFFATEDCNNVTISVVNLNTNTLNVGNDFALDDIQFHAISSLSTVVKSQQRFTLTVHEPKVDAFTATVVPLSCDAEPNYTVKMHVEYQNPNGQLIIKDVTTGTEYPYDLPAVAFDTPASLDKDIVVTGLTPATHEWEAYFKDWTTAKKTASTVSPGQPLIDTAKIAFSEPGCDDLYTSLTFDLNYTYQQGTFTYAVDAQAAQTATYNVADKEQKTLADLSFANIPADGKNNHILHISFDGANSCVKDYNLPAVPFSPVINSVTVSGVPDKLECNDENYTITVVIATPYDATGRNIVLLYDDNGAKTKTIAATGTSTTASLTLSNINAAAQTITAAYEAAPTCTKQSAAFTPPTRTPCEKYEDTVCEGTSYDKHGFSIPAPPVGVNMYINNGDTLVLTVLATPSIQIASSSVVCDSESDIRLAFSIEKGAPDSFVIRLNGVDYDATADGAELVMSRPTTLTPGNYNATVAIGQKGTECFSTASLTIRIDDSHIMYRKWEDVLFIDNSSRRYVGYQWYENGKELAGETKQHLYNPNGLPGTYFCRVTADDGSVFYTCELPFEQVTRSRDVSNNQEPAQVIRQYRVSPHVYIVQEQVGDDIQTRKIITPYE